MRTLLFLAAIFVAIAIIRFLWRRPGRLVDKAANRAVPQTMARCDHCGLFMPRQEAVEEGEHLYCCEEHRRDARNRR